MKISIRLKSRFDNAGFLRKTLIKAEIKNINAPTKAISIASKNISENPIDNLSTPHFLDNYLVFILQKCHKEYR